MTYPVIVICIAFAITTFLIVRVVPVFGDIFKDFGAQRGVQIAVSADLDLRVAALLLQRRQLLCSCWRRSRPTR